VYTPSTEGEAIRARLRSLHDADVSRIDLPDVPALRIRIGEYTVSLRIGNPLLREAIGHRFELCSVVGDRVALELTAIDYPTEDTDLLLSSPSRTVMAKRRGKLYFGIQDRETLRVLAGSLGAVDDDPPSDSDATGTDFVQCLIEAEIITGLGRVAPELDFVHAASISRNGRAVLLVGPSGSGKTTLSVAAAACGFELLGDDVACIDLKQCVAYPYPRKPRLRPASMEMLAPMGGEFPRPVTMAREPAIAAVCLLSGFARLPGLTPLRGVDTVWRMSRHIFHAGRPMAPIVGRVAERLPELPCYELLAGSLEETISLLSPLTESAEAVKRQPWIA
jgi:hypothetical protein